MKRAVGALVAALVIVLGVDLLADLTQDRPDRPAPGSWSEVLLRVTDRTFRLSTAEAAESLWAACRGTVSNRLLHPGLVPVRDGVFRFMTQPALGDHQWRRLRGCLQDFTLDRVKASVLSKRDLPPA